MLGRDCCKISLEPTHRVEEACIPRVTYIRMCCPLKSYVDSSFALEALCRLFGIFIRAFVQENVSYAHVCVRACRPDVGVHSLLNGLFYGASDCEPESHEDVL